MRPALFLPIFLILAGAGICSTIHVPGDYSSIQEAIDAAFPGDTVLVAPGTYVETIDFLGKAITVMSSGGAAVTVIDGAGGETVVTFDDGEGPDSVLDGFTVTNGSCGEDRGSAVHCSGSAPVIRHNTISGNASPWLGGTVYSISTPASLEISHNLISGNTGHGIFICDDAVVKNNTVKGNTRTGIYGYGAHALIESNVIAENLRGIQCVLFSTPTRILNNVIYGNYGGAGIHCEDSSPLIAGNVLFNNQAPVWGGGGIYCFHYSSPRIFNNLIFNNHAQGGVYGSGGGGIFCSNESNPLIRGNTLFGNTAFPMGGGISMIGGSFQGWECAMRDNILWGNTAPTGPEIYLEYSKLDISYCDVEGGQASVFVGLNASMKWGSGMIDADPLFADPSGGDFRLRQDPCQPGVVNPCVDAGSTYASNLCLHTAWTRTDGVPDACRADLGFHYGPYEAPSLVAAPYVLSAATGGSCEFRLRSSSNDYGRYYLMLGSMSGTSPGFPLPGGLAVMPLNWDAFSDLVLAWLNTPVFQKFLGTLSYYGNGEATLNTGPIPGGAGYFLYFAFCMNDPFDFASNPIMIEIVP